MEFPEIELKEFLTLQPNAEFASEGGKNYFLLPELLLPEKCEPAKVDALLCISEDSGYKCRLYFALQVVTPNAKNWNSVNKRILGRNWFAYSYQTPDNLSLSKKFLIQYDGISK
jgi:hypothetical protein